MKYLVRSIFAAVLALSAVPAFAATVQVTINDQPYTGPSNPKGVRLVAGQPFTLEIKVTGKVADPPWLNHDTTVLMNGAFNAAKDGVETFGFYLTPPGAGPLTLPAFDIGMAEGPKLHVDPIKLVVYPN